MSCVTNGKFNFSKKTEKISCNKNKISLEIFPPHCVHKEGQCSIPNICTTEHDCGFYIIPNVSLDIKCTPMFFNVGPVMSYFQITIFRYPGRIKYVLRSKFSKNFIYKSWSPSQIFFTEKKIRKIRLIFDAEKWLWKYKFCKLWGGCS